MSASYVRTFAEARDTLAAILESEEAALVLGAGASVTSGAPTGADLFSRLRLKFPLADPQGQTRLFDLGEAISDADAYGHQSLLTFVRDLLKHLKPSESYLELPRLKWRAIFTTNYDDLIEKAYEADYRAQTLQPIQLEDAANMVVARVNHVLLFFLMGSIRAEYGDKAAPVLTWADFTRSIQLRTSVVGSVCGIIASGGKMIYAGYSFNDFVFKTFLDEAWQKIGPRDVPYGHALLTDWPAEKKKAAEKLLSRKVIPIDGSFEDLAKLIREVAASPRSSGRLAAPNPPPAAGQKVAVGSSFVTLSEQDAAVFSESLDLLDETAIFKKELSPAERRDLAGKFLKGESTGWIPFAQEWAFRRPDYVHVRTALETQLTDESESGGVFLIHGPAGLGKSVMARQLAFDLYANRRAIVIRAKPAWRARPDLKLLDRVCDDLEQGLGEGQVLPPVVVIIDEAELLDRNVPFRAVTYLRGFARKVFFVLFARTNEYFRLLGEDKESKPNELIDLLVAHRLSDTMTSTETDQLISHIISLDLWAQDRIRDKAFWSTYVTNELNSSFFEAVYALVEQSQEPLRERVWSEYSNLSGLAREAYTLIAAMHQFGLPIKMEMLMRALKVPFADFDAQIIRSDARDVLFREHQNTELNLYFRGRAKLISQIVFERAVPDHSSQLECFCQILRGANPNEMFGADELDLVRTLLIQILGPSGYDQRFSANEQADLFAVATADIEDDVLEHHYGLAEKNANRLLSAREHLEKALQLSYALPKDLATVRETPQNIENSLALVLGALAAEALKRQDYLAASELFEEARNHFLNARWGAFPNPAAYDAHARMLKTRAERLFKTGTADRAFALAEALDVLDDGIQNVNAEQKLGLIELRASIFEELGVGEQAIADLTERASAGSGPERARYHVLLARMYFKDGSSAVTTKRMKRAFAHACTAAELDPSSFPAARLRAQAFQKVYPASRRDFLEYLQAAEKLPDARKSIWLLYELGVTAFDLNELELAERSFSQLRRLSGGHNSGRGILEKAGERGDEDPSEFRGRVIHGGGGSMKIQSEELAVFGDIWFDLRRQRFYTPRAGDKVDFLVAFNYRGIQAIELKRA